MRSTDECEMSRSCHRATFSNAAWEFERTTRARPLICSQVTGLRLCGMAEEPFCFAHLGTLQMADLGGDLVQSRRDDRQSGHVIRVAVALDHLRGNRRRLQA